MADQLCTPSDLASWLQQDLDLSTATLLVECGTAVVQATAEQRIVQVVDDEVTLDVDEWHRGLYLELPERPVTAVATVLIGATAVTDYSTALRRARLWRADGWRSTLTLYPSQPSTVTVTYTHGYASGHQRLQLARGSVLALIAGVYSTPTGATSVKIDDYAEVFEAMSARMEASPARQRLLRRMYGRPPGSAVLTRAS
jgi:hypothetical protein